MNRGNLAFVDEKKLEIIDGIKKNITEHLGILNSKIILPKKQGVVLEARLLAVVKSREKLHTNLYKLIDMASIDRDSDLELKNSIVSGLRNSYEELDDIIFLRPMRINEDLLFDDEDDDEEDYEIEGIEGASDDIISSLSDSKIMAGEIMHKILERITQIEDPEKLNREKLESTTILSIIEQYATR